MLDTTSGSRGFGCVTLVLGLILAFSATACNGGPTEPSYDDLVRMYTGRWRGNINGFEVVLDVQASNGVIRRQFSAPEQRGQQPERSTA